MSALALWPKGDGWGGGGLFEKQNSILLNHRDEEMAIAEAYKLPPDFAVRPFGERPGWGEDDPIRSERLCRDGWSLIQAPQYKENGLGAPTWIEMEPPEVWERVSPAIKDISLKMIISGLHERDGAWYVVEHQLFDQRTNETFSLGKTSWADWGMTGDLLFAKEGSLFRLNSNRIPDLEEVKHLADFSENRFEAKKAPKEAVVW